MAVYSMRRTPALSLTEAFAVSARSVAQPRDVNMKEDRVRIRIRMTLPRNILLLKYHPNASPISLNDKALLPISGHEPEGVTGADPRVGSNQLNEAGSHALWRLKGPGLRRKQKYEGTFLFQSNKKYEGW